MSEVILLYIAISITTKLKSHGYSNLGKDFPVVTRPFNLGVIGLVVQLTTKTIAKTVLDQTLNKDSFLCEVLFI